GRCVQGADQVWRGRIGVQIAPVTKDVAESIGLGKAQGVLVRGVEEGSPAEKAGLEAGDIITRFDGKPIEKPADLPRAVGNTKPGSKVGMTVFRRGGHKELSITVAEIEVDKVAAASPEKKAPVATGQHWGLAVSGLTEAQKKEFRVRGGVRVDAATEAAARAGIREGDLIVAIANAEVTSLKEFELIMSRVDKNRPISVLIRRGDGAQYVLIRPAK
uniref:PDZ domain-containing protein n=1 Tax=Limnohabitans sp. TaxID=1907725 RepID=UPI0028A26256